MANKAGYSTIISSRAQKEIALSWEWYEERQQGLGDHFINEVVNRIGQIERYPERYPTRYRTYKETLVQGFPFFIIYRVNKRKKTIRIVSVFHTSINPRKK
jgi:plasmid stabilization system protein ParE